MDFSFFFPKGTMICALPNWKNPRLLMPAQTFWQRWHNSELYPAFRTSARVYRLFLRCKAACNVVKLDQMDNDSWILGDFILNLFPQAVYGVVLIGTTGPAQKITIQFRDKNYQPVGYLKHAIKKMLREIFNGNIKYCNLYPLASDRKQLSSVVSEKDWRYSLSQYLENN